MTPDEAAYVARLKRRIRELEQSIEQSNRMRAYWKQQKKLGRYPFDVKENNPPDPLDTNHD